MSTPAEILSKALTNLANDRRRQITQYANLAPHPGTSDVPQRLLSDIGFLESIQFSYITAHPSHVTVPDDDTPRDVKQIILCAYGLQLDAARFMSSRSRIRTTTGPGVTGITPFPHLTDVLISAELDALTYSVQKNDDVRRNMTQQHNGPAYHFLVDRNGGVSVGPSLDDRTSVVPALSDNAIFIGLEGVLGLLRTDFEVGNKTSFFELPYTSLQLLTTIILLAKLFTAYPLIPHVISTGTDSTTLALKYTASTLLGELPHLNFSNENWKVFDTHGFDYSGTDDTDIGIAIRDEGSYDFATEIFRSDQAPPAIAARDVARTAIGTVDTAGAQSLLLGAYTSIASPERANDMENQTRRQVFVERLRITHTESDEAGSQAAHTSEGGASLTPGILNVTNTEPHTYNYATGLWGDGFNF